MAICFNVHGTIRLKKECVYDFKVKFDELLKKYDNNSQTMCNEEGLFQFIGYTRHHFIDDCRELIEENIGLIEDGRIWFDCYDEDGSVENPFPFVMLMEIVDGKLYEECMNTRLPYDWSFFNVDNEWFNKVKKLS
jgi:hypothetical protein